MLTRRQFAVGSAAVMSAGLGSGSGYADTVRSDTPLLIPKLVDAAKQANAVNSEGCRGTARIRPRKTGGDLRIFGAHPRAGHSRSTR